MEDLEGCAAAMAWDWGTDDIDADEDDGKQWVPVMPQTMKHAETPRPSRMEAPTQPVTLTDDCVCPASDPRWIGRTS